MLAEDSEKTAEKSTGIFNDQPIRQFYDPNQRSGKAVANSIGWQDRIAWDIYLFYTAGSEWTKIPPAPVDWMHQLKESWADRDRLRTGNALIKELAATIKKLVSI